MYTKWLTFVSVAVLNFLVAISSTDAQTSTQSNDAISKESSREHRANGTIINEIIRAGLVNPSDIAVDAIGNVYVTSNTSNVFKITPAGAIIEIIDAKGDGSGNDFDSPTAISVDPAGNVYVASGASNAFKITPAGVVSEIIDTLVHPRGVAVDAIGNVYVTDSNQDKAFKITPAGVITEIIDASGDGTGNLLAMPWDIAVDGSGNVYVTGLNSDNVFKITPAGLIAEIIDAFGDSAGNSLDRPGGIAVDNAGNVYVTSSTHAVFKITPGGIIAQIIDVTGDGLGNNLYYPLGIATDSAENVYVAGSGSDNAFKITPTGVITEIIDASGDGAGNSLDIPHRIAVDEVGNLYVTGGDSNNVFKIAPTGVITEIIDSTAGRAGHILIGAFGMASDTASNALVTGFYSNNAFKLAPDGSVTEIIDGDDSGNLCIGASGVAVDSASNVYVACSFSNNAFRISPAGIMTEIIDASGDGTGNILEYAVGIAVDGTDNVFVTGHFSSNAFKITPAGVITEIIDITGDDMGNELFDPEGIALDAVGNVYVVGLGSDNAFKITPAGVITQIIDASGDGSGNGLNAPLGVAADTTGNVFVTGMVSDNAFKIEPSGEITTIIDSAGDGAGNDLIRPYGIAVDAIGNVFVAGHRSHNAFRITPAGAITEIIDATGDGAGNDLITPWSIVADATGDVYVAGFRSHNVFKITSDCNSNGIPDACDVACGAAGGICDVNGCGLSADTDADGTPDECQSSSNVVFVDDDAPLGGDGTTWATAFTYLQDALASATAGDEIRVAQGIYTPDKDEPGNVTPGDRTATFQLVNGVELFGGYAGLGAPDPDARDIDLFEAILSGDLNGDDGPSRLGEFTSCYSGWGIPATPSCVGFDSDLDGDVDFDDLAPFLTINNYGENSRYIVWGSGTDDTTTLDGFTITASHISNGGAGMFISGIGSPNVSNCRFVGNDGGGMDIRNGASPTVTGCTFTENSHSGIDNYDSSPIVTGCTFSWNISGFGGGMANFGVNSTPTVTHSTFSNNSASEFGGGMANWNGSAPSVSNSHFDSNFAIGGGGGIDNFDSDLNADACVFTRNRSGGGGGVLSQIGSVSINNSLFVANSGGGMVNVRNVDDPPSDVVATSCTFFGNSTSDSRGGGGIRNENVDSALFNCILWANTSAGGLGDSVQMYNHNSAPTVSFSNLQGGLPPGTIDGGGNINEDPQFISPIVFDAVAGTSYFDLRLSCGSPCIDMGDNSTVTEATDLDGLPRIVEGDGDGIAIVDMGAYEYQGDCNGNVMLDAVDIETGTSQDCNNNFIPDECEIDENSTAPNGPFFCTEYCRPDCNANGVPDSCDIADGISEDCSADGVPDECDEDCNNNGFADSCDIAYGIDQDCNENDTPDECDLIAGSSVDCDGDTIPDDCQPDCNRNGIADSCDLFDGSSQDCNGDGIPDDCDCDCNTNGIPDGCDIFNGTSTDCNGNDVPDECSWEQDCNNNGTPDSCDIASGISGDCNGNGIPDECGGFFDFDCDANGTPDNCETPSTLILYVDDDAPGGDGLSWATAMNNLQDALAECATEIRVAQGTYKPGTLREDTFLLFRSVELYGGYAGVGAANPDVRDISLYETVLSGDINGDDAPLPVTEVVGCISNPVVPLTPPCDAYDVDADGDVDFEDFENLLLNASYGNYGENSYHVLTGMLIDDSTVISGFTITGGNANGTFGAIEGLGGGMLNMAASPTINQCVFQDNVATMGGAVFNFMAGGVGVLGAGCLVPGADETPSDPSSSKGLLASAKNLLENAKAPLADQPMSGLGKISLESSPIVTGCRFERNAAGFAGAMANLSGDPVISNCEFIDNFALFGGAMLNGPGFVSVNDSAFTNNTASLGGALYNGVPPGFGTPTTIGGGSSAFTFEIGSSITDCRFVGNTALATPSGLGIGGLGGAVFSPGSSSEYSSCEFDDNSAAWGGAMADGTGIFSGGGSSNVQNTGLALRDCKFWRNTASGLLDFPALGGGLLYSSVGRFVADRCTFGGNQAGFGGGVCSFGGNDFSIYNSSFTGNSAEFGGGFFNGNSDATVTNCSFSNNVATGSVGLPAEGGAILSGINVFQTCVAPFGTNLTVSNSIVWGNSPDQVSSDDSTQNAIEIRFSNLEGGLPAGLIDGGGNILVNPSFRNANGADGTPGTEDDDLSISAGSPCIDAAENPAVPLSLNTDILGQPRFVNDPSTPDTGVAEPPLRPHVVDMGAFEYQVDCNNNTTLDSVDISTGASLDCNGNDVPDECEIPISGTAPGGPFFCTAGCDADCNDNGIPDACDLVTCVADPACDDCNLNGVLDSCDIAAGTSEDLTKPFGVPDECTVNTGTGSTTAWTDGSNWDLNGDFPNNIGVGGVPDLHVTIGGLGLSLDLDTAVTIPSLRILDGITLNVFGTNGEDLMTEGGILLAGDATGGIQSFLHAGNDRQIDVGMDGVGRFEINSGGVYEAAPGASPTAALTAPEVLITSNSCNDVRGGIMDLSGTMSVQVDGDFTLRGNVGCGSLLLAQPDTGTVAGGFTPPVKKTRDAAIVDIDGVLNLYSAASWTNESSGGVILEGDFENQSLTPSQFDWTEGRIVLNSVNSSIQLFEVAGLDLGPTLEGFATDHDALGDTRTHTNFSIGTVEIAPGATVRFVNSAANTVGAGACKEALYVETFLTDDTSTVIVDNCRVYFLWDYRGQFTTVQTIGCGELVQLPNGDANDDRKITLDDWQTFESCALGAYLRVPISPICKKFDLDGSGVIDLQDFAYFQNRVEQDD